MKIINYKFDQINIRVREGIDYDILKGEVLLTIDSISTPRSTRGEIQEMINVSSKELPYFLYSGKLGKRFKITKAFDMASDESENYELALSVEVIA